MANRVMEGALLTDHGRKLKRLREDAGLTQGEVAAVSGVHIATVSHWELGLCFPAVGRLSGLAKLYGVSIDELLSPAQ